MIVGPTKALFMDEISNGLDSSTTYQIICYLQQLAHITDATILVSLLQPAPETFDLFDDIILMGDGKIVYHGPTSDVLEFFRNCGFRCPERKGVADFLQEVLSRKDQEQYWDKTEQPYRYVSIDTFCRKYKEFHHGKKINEELSLPFDKSKSHKNAISFSVYSLPKWELFRACLSREFLLMRRNSFIYVFKTVQLLFISAITMTVFLRTEMGVDVVHANSYLGALFYTLIILLVDGFPELSMTVARLPVFYKQRDLYFYPAWAYTIPATILKIPLSILEAVVWTGLTYYVIGYSPEAGRLVLSSTDNTTLNSLDWYFKLFIKINALLFLQVFSPDDRSIRYAHGLVIHVPFLGVRIPEHCCIYNSRKYGDSVSTVVQWVSDPTT